MRKYEKKNIFLQWIVALITKVLHHAKVTLISSDECKKEKLEVDESEVCARYLGVDPCKGDSGGPLQCPTDSGIWVREGVISHGDDRCLIGVFTSTEKHLDWMKK